VAVTVAVAVPMTVGCVVLTRVNCNKTTATGRGLRRLSVSLAKCLCMSWLWNARGASVHESDIGRTRGPGSVLDRACGSAAIKDSLFASLESVVELAGSSSNCAMLVSYSTKAVLSCRVDHVKLP
jgi:hypothetical protein